MTKTAQMKRLNFRK